MLTHPTRARATRTVAFPFALAACCAIGGVHPALAAAARNVAAAHDASTARHSADHAPAASVGANVEEHILSNGMRLLLVPRHLTPTVSGAWVAHVGSANERPGITGISHLFEHMMFKGTPTIGTKDYERDQKIILQQEAVREQMRQEEARMRAAWRHGEIDDLQKPEN